ncbi:virion core protein [Swinepox virus]|nr:virion core protein [Swinepox virus]
MDFMKNYSKQLSTTVKNKKDEELVSTKDVVDHGAMSDVNTILKSKEHIYQQLMTSQLQEKNILKIKKEVIYATTDKQMDNERHIDPLQKKINDMSKSELIRECNNIKDTTIELKNDSESLVEDIQLAKNNTFDTINAIMNDLKRKFQLDNLDIN